LVHMGYCAVHASVTLANELAENRSEVSDFQKRSGG